jgi:acyl carrier protein
MVPSAFVILSSLPLSPTGTVDRGALTGTYTNPEPDDTFAPPRTPAEELVVDIWKAILHVSRVGIYSSFFDLGGDSLLAIRVILRLREIFRIELPLRCLFETLTVDGLVKSMAQMWGGREIVEEIAWAFMQVEQLSDRDVEALLEKESTRL